MKMGFIFSGVFWGVIIVILGLSIIVNVLFGVRIPIVRILFAIFLIWLGITLLTGGSFWSKNKHAAIFEEKKIDTISPSGKYDIVFGKGVIDLSNIVLKDEVYKVEVNTVFGSGTIEISKEMPAKVVVNSVFAGASMPDGNTIAFGQYTYKSDSLKDNKNYLLVNASVVFGGLQIESK
jgi:predicted membrane protein